MSSSSSSSSSAAKRKADSPLPAAPKKTKPTFYLVTFIRNRDDYKPRGDSWSAQESVKLFTSVEAAQRYVVKYVLDDARGLTGMVDDTFSDMSKEDKNVISEFFKGKDIDGELEERWVDDVFVADTILKRLYPGEFISDTTLTYEFREIQPED